VGDQERPTAAGTAQSPADGLTSATQIGTGEWEAMRRASFTSEAVPGATGKGHHQHRGDRNRGGVGHGFGNGLLEELAIADRPSGPAMPLPLGWHHHRGPAQLMGRPANGGIGPTGPAMENQMDQPAATAGEELSGNALMGPGQITAATGRDHQRAGGAYCRT
jgi:hypothetical protein